MKLGSLFVGEQSKAPAAWWEHASFASANGHRRPWVRATTTMADWLAGVGGQQTGFESRPGLFKFSPVSAAEDE